jgi:hypothetical protein
MIAGSTALGAFLCGPVLLVLLRWMPDLIKLLILFGGSLLGAFVGFSGGLRWCTRQGTEPWRVAGWTGAALGLGLGLWLWLAGKLDRLDLIWFTTLTRLFLIAFLFLLTAAGGLVGALLAAQWKRWSKSPSKRSRSVRSGR